MSCLHCRFWDKENAKGEVAYCLKLRKFRVRLGGRGANIRYGTRYAQMKTHESNGCPDFKSAHLVTWDRNAVRRDTI